MRTKWPPSRTRAETTEHAASRWRRRTRGSAACQASRKRRGGCPAVACAVRRVTEADRRVLREWRAGRAARMAQGTKARACAVFCGGQARARHAARGPLRAVQSAAPDVQKFGRLSLTSMCARNDVPNSVTSALRQPAFSTRFSDDAVRTCAPARHRPSAAAGASEASRAADSRTGVALTRRARARRRAAAGRQRTPPPAHHAALIA
jgi:hypothetical protein